MSRRRIPSMLKAFALLGSTRHLTRDEVKYDLWDRIKQFEIRFRLDWSITSFSRLEGCK